VALGKTAWTCPISWLLSSHFAGIQSDGSIREAVQTSCSIVVLKSCKKKSSKWMQRNRFSREPWWIRRLRNPFSVLSTPVVDLRAHDPALPVVFDVFSVGRGVLDLTNKTFQVSYPHHLGFAVVLRLSDCFFHNLDLNLSDQPRLLLRSTIFEHLAPNYFCLTSDRTDCRSNPTATEAIMVNVFAVPVWLTSSSGDFD
jgi:hypothetical protein